MTIKSEHPNEKKRWDKPLLVEINTNTIKQQEEEFYLQLLADQELFQRISGSGDSDAG